MAKYSLGTLSADGSTDDINWYNHRNGKGTIGSFHGYGTFGSGTLRLQASPDGGTTWFNVGTNTLSSSGVFDFELPSDASNPLKLRGTITGSTTPSVAVEIWDTK